MATIQKKSPIKPTRITQFLGLNICNTGDTQLKLGESGNMDNFYITGDCKLRKIYGYKKFIDFEDEIQGMFSTRIGSTGYLLVATGGKLYYFLQSDLENESDYKIGATKTFDVDGSTNSFCVGERISSVISSRMFNNGTPPDGYHADTFELDNETGTITFAQGYIDSIIQTWTNITYTVTYNKTAEPTLIGNIGNGDCSFFEFDNKVYILCDGYYNLLLHQS